LVTDAEGDGLVPDGGADLSIVSDGILQVNLDPAVVFCQGTHMDQCMAELSRRKGDPTFQKLRLRYFFSNKQHLKTVLKSLETNTTVTHLDLSGNKLDSGFDHTIVEFLVSNSTVQTLCLHANQMVRTNVLFPSLATNRVLTCLDLSAQTDRLVDVSPIAALLEAGSSALTNLNLARNHINTSGARLLFPALSRNRTLKAFDLCYNPLAGGSCAFVAACLEENCSLKLLGIEGCGLEEGNIDIVITALEKNTAVTDLGGLLPSSGHWGDTKKRATMKRTILDTLRRNLKYDQLPSVVMTLRCAKGEGSGMLMVTATNIAGDDVAEIQMLETERVSDLRFALLKQLDDGIPSGRLCFVLDNGQALEDKTLMTSLVAATTTGGYGSR